MITFILVLILLYVAARYIIPYLLPHLIMAWVRKQQPHNPNHTGDRKRSEGSIKVDYIPKADKHLKKRPTNGEYIDFEEINNN